MDGWPDVLPMGFLTDSGHARVVMHAWITNSRFPLKSVASLTFRNSQRRRELQVYVSASRPMWTGKHCGGKAIQDIPKDGDLLIT